MTVLLQTRVMVLIVEQLLEPTIVMVHAQAVFVLPLPQTAVFVVNVIVLACHNLMQLKMLNVQGTIQQINVAIDVQVLIRAHYQDCAAQGGLRV